jgi:hypothetical protein
LLDVANENAANVLSAYVEILEQYNPRLCTLYNGIQKEVIANDYEHY